VLQAIQELLELQAILVIQALLAIRERSALVVTVVLVVQPVTLWVAQHTFRLQLEEITVIQAQ
jgi:hypothetical protein